MKRLMTASWTCLCLAAALSSAVAAANEKNIDSAAARKIFADPPRQYATAPLWVWNDMLTDEQIRGTMRDLAGQKVRQVFVHPRPGLMTPYLSDEWFRLWRVALDEAEKLDMNVWIYDENSYPSGFAGGHVPELMPESRGRGLVFRDEKQSPKIAPDTVAVYRQTGDTCENITELLRRGELPPEGRYVVASVARAKDSPWHGDRCYVDLMYPGVTEKFLEVTLDPYKKHVGDQFGTRVLGAFTDEPNVRPAGGLPWTDRLPAEFQKRWGYNLLDHLPSLARPVGNWKQVRHNYYQVVLEQFIEHWAKPYYNWCDQNGIAFTGHYWDHEWPNCLGVTDNMAMSAWQHIPGIDCLMNQYREDTHAQFGNVRFVREVQSLCNQLGRERFLCEVYGAGGWDLRFEDMKRIADWLGVLGVNLFDEHLSYVTLRGARKADHPQSFSYHEPWWNSYHVMAQYITRLSAAMSTGEQRNRVLVIEPTTTAWMYQLDATHAGQLGEIGKTFFDLLKGFEQAQVEYDIGCEDVIARHGSVSRGEGRPGGRQVGEPFRFAVGRREYTTIVLPPMTETLRSETMKLLEEAAPSGLQILSCGPPPALVDGRPSGRGAKLAACPGWQQVDPARVTEMLVPVLGLDRCAIRRAADDKGILFHQRRQLADGDLLLIVNTSIEAPSRGFVESQAKGVQKWDLFTGAVSGFPFVVENGAAKVDFDLPPCGSLLLFLSKEPSVVRGSPDPAPGTTGVVRGSPDPAPGTTGVVRGSPDPAPGTTDRSQAPAVADRSAESGRPAVGGFGEVGRPAPNPSKAAPMAPRGPLQIARVEPNVLTLDYVDITAGGETQQNLYYYRANQLAWQKNGLPRNPWNSAVQYKDELISKTFPPDSGFEVTYRFTIDGPVPQPLWVVIERPDLYAITCNGKPLTAGKNSWWLDKAFGKIDVTAAAQQGENAVTLKARPFTMYHEIAAAFVLGEFSLRPAPAGFVIVPPQTPSLETGWNQQGMPFYAAGVAYRQSFAVDKTDGRFKVCVPRWYGSVAKVVVNGKLCGHLVSQPWEVDVTDAVRSGENAVEVVVVGTLKNTLGPHHAGSNVGSAWPGMFQQGPEHGPPAGSAYHTLGYGLFEPFSLMHETP